MADRELFFFISVKTNFILFSLFSYNKKELKEKKIWGRPTGHNFGHRLDGKKTFFKGGLTIHHFKQEFPSFLACHCVALCFNQGMVDPGEKVSVTLKREFSEEALNTLEMSKEESHKLEEQIKSLFQQGTQVSDLNLIFLFFSLYVLSSYFVFSISVLLHSPGV